jgi:ribosomal-protein-alanine N-acetyltransferase
LWIKRALLEDISAIEAIEQSATSAWSRSHIEDEIRHPGGIALVIRQEHEGLVGWCCSRLLPPDAELLKITILPEFRNSGCGSSLLVEVMKQCLQNGCESLFLEVRKTNYQALSFYRKHGFLQIGLRKDYYGNPLEDGLILKKFLTY